MRAVAMVAWWALACGTSRGVEPLSAIEEQAPVGSGREPSASDYSAHLDVLALGYDDGIFEVRSPAPQHVVSRGKHAAAVVNVAVTRDGQRIATTDNAGSVVVSETNSGELRPLEPVLAGSGPVGLGWDAEGKRLAVGTESSVRIVEVESGKTTKAELGTSAHAVAFAHGDREVAVGGARVTFVSVPDLKETRRLALPEKPGEQPPQVLDLRFSPDGRTLGVLLNNGVALFDLEAHAVETEQAHDLRLVGLRFASDGKIAAFARNKLYVGEGNAESIRAGMRETSGKLWDVQFRKDDSLLVFGQGVEELTMLP